MAAEYFGARAALLGALVLATSLALPIAARTDGTQLLATLLGWIGAAGLADAVFGRAAGRGSRLVVAYGALGWLWCSRGILPALWPLGALALYLALARAPRRGGAPRNRCAGLALMLGLLLPWYGAMVERHGGDVLSRTRRSFRTRPRRARSLVRRTGAVRVSLPVFGFFPWSALLPAALAHAAAGWRRPRPPVGAPRPGVAAVAGAIAGSDPRSGRPAPDPLPRERREEHAAHFCIACLIAGLAPVLVLPDAAAAGNAAGAARGGDALWPLARPPVRGQRARSATALGRAVTMLAALGSGIGILLATIAPRVREAAPDLRLLGSITLLASWAPLLAHLVGRRRAAAALIALPVALGTPIVTLARAAPGRGLAQRARRGAGDGRRLAGARDARAGGSAARIAPALHRRNLVVARPLAPALEEQRAADGLTYLAFRPAREREVARAAGAPSRSWSVLRAWCSRAWSGLEAARFIRPRSRSVVVGFAPVGPFPFERRFPCPQSIRRWCAGSSTRCATAASSRSRMSCSRRRTPTTIPRRPPVPARRACATVIAAYQNAFEGAHWDVEEMISADGDVVLTRWNGTGTHTGELMGIAPTKKRVKVAGIWVHRISAGRIVESWNIWDTLGLLQQLGVVPSSSEEKR